MIVRDNFLKKKVGQSMDIVPPHKYGMLGEGFVLWFMFKLTKMHPQKFGKLTQKKLDKKFLYILMYRGRGIDQVEALAPTQLL